MKKKVFISSEEAACNVHTIRHNQVLHIYTNSTDSNGLSLALHRRQVGRAAFCDFANGFHSYDEVSASQVTL